MLRGEEMLHAEGGAVARDGGLLDEEDEVPHEEGAQLDKEGEPHE